MRVSRVQAAENRETVINAASRLFRENGFDGIGLKDLMKGANLTQGAFYKQFESKDDLAAKASARALECAVQRWSEAAAANPEDPLEAVMSLFLSAAHREERADGCPLVALGADAARQGSEVKASFEAGIRTHFDLLARFLGDGEHAQPTQKAMVILSLMVGAVTLSRAVNDVALAQSILDAAADQVRAVGAAKDSGTRRSGRRVKRAVRRSRK
jgi:TetR/AcrR family transcriptional regulator, transcriptional repressor for nem operon